ncbi:MAG: TRAP transporter large permease [Firmicutes bacterium]|nr:TRAP transporter large permease [Bacillota bacterium]
MAMLFGLLIVFMILSIPVGVSVGLSSVLTALSTGIMSGGYALRTLVSAYDSFPILAVPLFLLAGEIMSRGGISERLFDLAHLVVGRFTGGVPMAVVACCLMFGALSGAGAADTAAVGAIMIPAMVRMGYPKAFSASIVACAGGLAIVMPPSLSLILYGVGTGESIGSLFKAGILPACIVALFLMIYCYFFCRRRDLTNENVKVNQEKSPWQIIKSSFLAILMPVIILGGIYGGYFTPTEAAGIATAYGFIVSVFVYKTVKLSECYDILLTSAKQVGPILIILGGATIFGNILILNEVPQQVADMILSITDNKFLFLLFVNVLLLLVGIFMETLSSVMILAPILCPVAVSMGIDPVHFGIIMVVNLAIGLMTPPMAVNLFIVSSISKLSIEELVKEIWKPFLILIAALLVVTYVPIFVPALLLQG